MIKKTSIIPVAMMFNNNYAIPASVAILSLLQNADEKYTYKLYILHNDISKRNQEKLISIVTNFKNASLNFLNMKNRFKKLQTKCAYPKELLYKFLIPSIFKLYDKMIITDVDVVFLGDISKAFIQFKNDTENYFAGVKQIQEDFHKKFSTNIQDSNVHFICGAGYMIYNLALMRQDGVEQKCLDYFVQNYKYAKYPDQDVLSQVCYPKIKLLHPKNMFLSAWYDNKNFLFDFPYTATQTEYQEAKDNPVQLHFVDSRPGESGKPWINPSAIKAEVWYEWLLKTPFSINEIKKLRNSIKREKEKIHIFKKIKKANGHRQIYFLGFKIFSYKKKSHLNSETSYSLKFKSCGTDVEIQPNCRIYNESQIELGNNIRIGQGALIEGMGHLSIGNNVILGPDVTIWTANHNYEKPTKLPYDEKVIFKPVHVEDNVWIGGKSIILPGVTIYEGAVIGMGAVVTKDVPKCAVVGGNPAKVLKYRDISRYEQLKKENKIFLFKQEE